MHGGKLGQITYFTIVGGTAKHCIDQYMVLFCYCSLGDDTAIPGGLHAILCRAFLVRPLSKLAERTVYFACVNFFLSFFFKVIARRQIIAGSAGPIW